MSNVVIGTPLAAFGDVLFAVLAADTVLPTLSRTKALLVTAALPRDARVPFPYVTVGGSRRELKGSGFAMGVFGGEGGIWVDVWSDFNGPEEAQDLQGRIRALLLRDPSAAVAQGLLTAGVRMIADSVTCEDEQVFQDVDAGMPARTLYHGVQRWTADLEEMG